MRTVWGCDEAVIETTLTVFLDECTSDRMRGGKVRYKNLPFRGEGDESLGAKGDLEHVTRSVVSQLFSLGTRSALFQF